MAEREVLTFAIRGIDAEIIDSAGKISRCYWEYKKEPLRICALTEMRREIGSRLKAMDAAEAGEEPEAEETAAAEGISRTELLELALFAVEHKIKDCRIGSAARDVCDFIAAVNPLIEKRDILRKALEEAKTK